VNKFWAFIFYFLTALSQAFVIFKCNTFNVSFSNDIIYVLFLFGLGVSIVGYGISTSLQFSVPFTFHEVGLRAEGMKFNVDIFKLNVKLIFSILKLHNFKRAFPYWFRVVIVGLVGYFVFSVFQFSDSLVFICLLLIGIVLFETRRIVSVFLDALGYFALNRLFAALQFSVVILLLIVNPNCLITGGVLSFLCYYMLGLFISFLASVFLLSRGEILIKKQDEDSVIKLRESQNSWYLLSTMSATLNVVYANAINFNDLNFDFAPIYYAQKFIQFINEFINQSTRIFLANFKSWIISGRMKSKVLIFSSLISLCVPLSLFFVFLWTLPTLTNSMFLVVTFCINETIASITNFLGQIALYFGAIVPAKTHLWNSIFSIALILFLHPIFNISVLPISSLIAGLLFSYRINFKLFFKVFA
jgi:hypothetical protein